MRGFTLVELLLVITILGTLIVAAFITMNSSNPLLKANDSKRSQELEEIKTALDAYYNDNNCFPTSIPFGSEWKVGTTVYMKEVPQDPNCASDDSACYIYKYSGGSCPQWHTVFVKLAKEPTQEACIVTSLPSCSPTDYSSEWACATAGTIDCTYLSSTYLVTDPSGGSEDEDGESTSPTPTPTPEVCNPNQRNYACTGTPARCNVVGNGNGTYCSSSCLGAC